MMHRTSWATDEMLDLIYFREAEKLSWREIGRRLDRTEEAVSAKYRVIMGLKRNNPLKPRRSPLTPALAADWGEAPPRRENDDHKHLTLLLAAIRRGEHLPRIAA